MGWSLAAGSTAAVPAAARPGAATWASRREPPEFVERRRERLGRLLERQLAEPPVLSEPARRLVTGGKKLRARMLFAAAPPRLDEPAESLLAHAAAAIELLHAGSLIHDDMVDHCDTRRGETAVHAQQGARAAALSGAWTMLVATALFSRLPETARRRFAATARDVSRGQLDEILRSHDLSLSAVERISIMERKTASVFALACEVGGRLGGTSEGEAAGLAAMGASFGLVYQLADDLEDVFAEESELGRKPGADLREGVLSLPLVLAAEAMGPERVGEVLAWARGAASGDSARRIRGLLRRHGVIRRLREIVRRWCDRAGAEIDALAAARDSRGGRAGCSGGEGGGGREPREGLVWIRGLLGDLVARVEARLEGRYA